MLSGKSTSLQPIWPGFKSLSQCRMLVGLLLVLSFAPRGFFHALQFLSLLKNQHFHFSHFDAVRASVKGPQRGSSAINTKFRTYKVIVHLRIVMFLITCRFYPSGEAFGTASDDATVSIPNSTPPPPKQTTTKTTTTT